MPRNLLPPADGTAERALLLVQTATTRVKERVSEGIANGWSTGKITEELNKCISDVCKTVDDDGFREQLRRALVAAARKWHYELTMTYRILNDSLTRKAQALDLDITAPLRSTPFVRMQEFRKVLDEGTNPGIPVIKDYWQSVRLAVKAMSADPPKVYMGSGRAIPVRLRAEMAVRYAAAVENLQSLIDGGVKFCWISSHSSCSPRCAPYQGKLYSLFQGTVVLDGVKYGERGTIDGIPYRPINEALAGANGDGNGCISGYNCRHRAIEYQRGSRPPQDYTEAQMKKEYAVDRRQRAYENNIRQLKTEERQLRAMGMTKDASDLRKKWRRLTKDYEIYSLEHGRAFYRYRCAVDSAELQSNAKEDLTEPSESGTISIEDCKDFDGLSSYMTTVCGITVDESVRNLDFPAVKQSLTGVEQVIREFPQAQGMLKEISTGKSGIMATYFSGRIDFNPAYYRNGNPSVSPITAERSATGFHPSNMGVQGVGSHEMGHILERVLIEQAHPDDGSISSRLARLESWKKCKEAKNVISEACKAAKQTPEGKGLPNIQLQAQVSRYAAKNYSECMAECVADCITNGENASLLAREVWKILKRRLS